MRKIPVPVGYKFGKLLVIGDGPVGKWLVVCDCGTEKLTGSGKVRSGETVSCGCHRRSNASAMFSTHGLCETGSYGSWKSMNRRIKVDPDYVGVVICERWNDFENFYADMGDRPAGMSLDRIDATNGYTPGNCRWATPKEQSDNRKSVVMLTFEGKTQCVSDWAREIGLGRKTIMKRYRLGLPIDEILNPSKHPAGKKHY